MVPHSILVGVDGSEAAADAVRWAVGLLREGDTLCLVTVASEADAVRRAPDILAAMQDAAHKAGAPPDRVVTHIVPKSGSHGEVLVAYAEPAKFKLLVVGSRGRGAVKLALGALLGVGSVSAYVLKHARLPTAVVRKGTVVMDLDPPEPITAEPHRMCMAVDESPSAHYAVEWALSNLVRPDKDEMYLISVIVTPKKEPEPVVIHKPVDPDDPDTSIPIIGAVDARPAAIITANDAVRKASNKAVQAGVPKSRIHIAVLDPVRDGGGDVAGAIVRFCAVSKVYTLGIGHRGRRSGLSAAGIGSVAFKVVRDAACPVVVVRAVSQPRPPNK